MSSLSPALLLSALKKLGEHMRSPHVYFNAIIHQAQQHNGWFTPEETERSLLSLGDMLNEADLDTWFDVIRMTPQPKKIGLILAGNIPLVGFHDILCVLATGHTALLKMSSSDDQLLPVIVAHLIRLEPLIGSHIQYTERLSGFDAVMATGSNNSSRYFEYYFGKVPHIIRKNRNSVAVLDGLESDADIERLGHDIFDYYGLGCRNVSKIYIPAGYAIEKLFKPLEKFRSVADHFKYHNNYDYHKSIYLVNGAKHYDNGFLIVKEDSTLASPLAVLHYETYLALSDVYTRLEENKEHIQCVIARPDLDLPKKAVGFGQSQNPKLWDYADDVNTINFLEQIR